MIRRDKGERDWARFCASVGVALLLAGPGRADAPFVAAVAKTAPALLQLSDEGGAALGTGVVLTRAGLALVVARRLTTRAAPVAAVGDGRTARVEVVAEFDEAGLALVRVRAAQGLPTADVSARGTPPAGTPLVALTVVDEGPVALACLVAAVVPGPDDKGTLRLDRPLPGPAVLVDETGAVVGASEAAPAGAVLTTAHPAPALFDLIERGLALETRLPDGFGARLIPRDGGLFVDKLAYPSAAVSSGVTRRDVIVAVGLWPVRDTLDVWLALAEQGDAKSVPVKVRRAGADKLLFLKRPPATTGTVSSVIQARWGVVLDDGLVVTALAPGGPGTGLRVGDRVVRAGVYAVRRPDDVAFVLSAQPTVAGLALRGTTPVVLSVDK